MGVKRDRTIKRAGSPLSIARITALLARQAELALTETCLSLPQYRVLGLLAEGRSLPSSMADRLDVRRPSITAVVDGLVTRGLVLREHDEEDRRQVTHSLTEAGRELLATADNRVDERLRAIAGCLDQEPGPNDALEGLDRWGPALVAWRAQKLTAPPS